MNTKSKVEKLFKDFYKMIENQFQTKISILRSDNGTKYFNQFLSSFLTENEILHQSTCRNTLQQNGIAERKNKHLLEVSRALMFFMNVHKYLWGEAVLTAAYRINRVPSRVLQHKTPFNYLKKVFPHNRINSPSSLKIFGCTVFVHKPNLIRSKLDARSEKCIFLRYAPNERGYKCFNPTKKKTYVSMDVTLLENTPFLKNHLQGERKREDDSLDFLDTPTPLPVLIDPTDFSVFNPPQTISKSVVDLEPNKKIVNLESEFVLESNKETGPHLETLESNLLLHQFGTNSGEEISQDNHPNLEHCLNTELQVYTRRKPPFSNRDFLHQVPAQSKPPGPISGPQMT
ncbi:hypothetical protein ACOSP7_010279 [Xanthoceras sorbifolium]